MSVYGNMFLNEAASKIKTVKIVPTKTVGDIKFGMSRDEVRKNKEYKEFKKTKLSKNSTDDFGNLHVYYTKDDIVEAVEIFKDNNIKPIVSGKDIFSISVKSIKNLFPNINITGDGSYIDKEKSVGIEIKDGAVTSVLFAVAGYYN